jgi:hypothetical protein
LNAWVKKVWVPTATLPVGGFCARSHGVLCIKRRKISAGYPQVDKDGTVTFIYFEGEAGGFAMHLKKR